MVNLGLLVLRLVTGALVAGHGAQKLFGAFGGGGLERTAGMMGAIGLRPGRFWAATAGASEFFSGVLTTLGLFHPLGPIMMMGPMAMAVAKVHWGKPIWVTEGGGELPVTNAAVATSLAVSGPGKLSLDNLFGVRVPFSIAAITALTTLAGIGLGLTGQLEEVLPEEEPALPAQQRPATAGAETSAATESSVPIH